MDISKSFNISSDYKDRRAPPNWELMSFAEVILIDRTHDALQPMIYQLKDNVKPTHEEIFRWRSDHSFIPEEAFILIGEAISIDRKKKQILLKNKTTIRYNYMIIASGSNPVFTFQDEKFLAAFHALIEALRIKDKIPSSFAMIEPQLNQLNWKSTKSSFLAHFSPIPDGNIGRIAQPYICQALHHKSFGPDLHTINKRLYEVHL